MKTIAQILSVLAQAGATADRLKNCEQYDQGKLKDAAAGEPTKFSIAGSKLGNCYYRYTDVCLNYDDNDASKPNGMCGKVEPFKVEVFDGVKVATFIYSIDSGD
jgi:hypothetical protein